MSASVNDLNPFKKDDRVKVNNPKIFLDKMKGTVKHVFDVSTEVKLDNGITAVVPYKNLIKLKKK